MPVRTSSTSAISTRLVSAASSAAVTYHFYDRGCFPPGGQPVFPANRNTQFCLAGPLFGRKAPDSRTCEVKD